MRTLFVHDKDDNYWWWWSVGKDISDPGELVFNYDNYFFAEMMDFEQAADIRDKLNNADKVRD